MIQAVQEGFTVLQELEVPITPLHLRLLELFPTRSLEDLLLQWARTPEFDVLVASHVRAARGGNEMPRRSASRTRPTHIDRDSCSGRIEQISHAMSHNRE